MDEEEAILKKESNVNIYLTCSRSISRECAISEKLLERQAPGFELSKLRMAILSNDTKLYSDSPIPSFDLVLQTWSMSE